MIIDALLRILMIPINALLSLMPSFDTVIPDGVSTSITNLIQQVSYFAPLNTVFTIFGLMIAMYGVKIAIAIIVRIKSFIPTMGD